MSGRRRRMPMLDSRRYWRVFSRKSQGDYPSDQSSRFERVCRSNTSLDAILQAVDCEQAE